MLVLVQVHVLGSSVWDKSSSVTSAPPLSGQAEVPDVGWRAVLASALKPSTISRVAQ